MMPQTVPVGQETGGGHPEKHTEPEKIGGEAMEGPSGRLGQLAGQWTERISATRCVGPVLALVCVALYSWPQMYSPDSKHYLDIARTIATEGQVATYHLQVTAQRVPDTEIPWPPGYPYLLSLWMRLGCDDAKAAWAVSVLSYGAVALLLLCVLRRPEWLLLGTVMWLWLIWNCEVVTYAWSEGPFFALLLGAAIAWGVSLGAGWPRALGMAFLAGVLGGAAVLTRYVGVCIVPSFFLAGVVVAASPGRDRGERAKAVVVGAVAGLVAAVAMLLWMWRNQELNGSPLGPARIPSDLAMRGVLWPLALLLASTGTAVGLPVAVSHALARPSQSDASADSGESTRTAFLSATALLMGMWVVVYVVFLVWQETTICIDTLSDRLMFPAYAGGLMGGLLLLESRCALSPSQARRLGMAAGVVALVLLLPGARMFKNPHTVRNRIHDWVAQNTAEDALLIGHHAWNVRHATGRTVLESGSWWEGKRALDGSAVSTFLGRHGRRFSEIYLLVSDVDWPAARDSYGAAGLKLTPIYAAKDDAMGEAMVLRVQFPAAPSGP